MKAGKQIDRLLAKAQHDPRILAVLLFGSAARGEQTAHSDFDVCLVLPPGRYAPLQVSRIKLAYLGETDLDVQVFQQLPLYVRRRVLKEGRVVFSRDDDALYDLAFRTARAFERFTRLDGARDRDGGGTGLGLAIVAELVRRHGGTVRLTSDEGAAGLRAEVILPRGGTRADR